MIYIFFTSNGYNFDGIYRVTDASGTTSEKMGRRKPAEEGLLQMYYILHAELLITGLNVASLFNKSKPKYPCVFSKSIFVAHFHRALCPAHALGCRGSQYVNNNDVVRYIANDCMTHR
jgi:hypothetical protein